MQELLSCQNKMQDAFWSPQFAVDAKQAIFYFTQRHGSLLLRATVIRIRLKTYWPIVTSALMPQSKPSVCLSSSIVTL